MPPVKSRYSLPSESQTRMPSPRTRATGYRVAKVMRCLSDISNICFVSTGRLPRVDAVLEDDLRPDAFLGQDLEQDRVRHPSVDDVRFLGSTRQGTERGFDLGQHAPVDHVALDQPLRLPLGQRRDVLAVVAVDTLHVRQVEDRKSTRLNSNHITISYAVFCLK